MTKGERKSYAPFFPLVLLVQVQKIRHFSQGCQRTLVLYKFVTDINLHTCVLLVEKRTTRVMRMVVVLSISKWKRFSIREANCSSCRASQAHGDWNT